LYIKIIIIPGDLTARVGNSTIRNVVCTEGDYAANKNSQRLIEFTVENDFPIANTVLRHNHK